MLEIDMKLNQLIYKKNQKLFLKLEVFMKIMFLIKEMILMLLLMMQLQMEKLMTFLINNLMNMILLILIMIKKMLNWKIFQMIPQQLMIVQMLDYNEISFKNNEYAINIYKQYKQFILVETLQLLLNIFFIFLYKLIANL